MIYTRTINKECTNVRNTNGLDQWINQVYSFHGVESMAQHSIKKGSYGSYSFSILVLTDSGEKFEVTFFSPDRDKLKPKKLSFGKFCTRLFEREVTDE